MQLNFHSSHWSVAGAGGGGWFRNNGCQNPLLCVLTSLPIHFSSGNYCVFRNLRMFGTHGEKGAFLRRAYKLVYLGGCGFVENWNDSNMLILYDVVMIWDAISSKLLTWIFSLSNIEILGKLNFWTTNINFGTVCQQMLKLLYSIRVAAFPLSLGMIETQKNTLKNYSPSRDNNCPPS